jgi:hypothetical protein
MYEQSRLMTKAGKAQRGEARRLIVEQGGGQAPQHQASAVNFRRMTRRESLNPPGTMELTLARMTEQARHDYTLNDSPARNNHPKDLRTLTVIATPNYIGNECLVGQPLPHRRHPQQRRQAHGQ